MVESFKLFVRTYVYWVGFILGFAIVLGSLLSTVGVAPVNLPLWLAPIAGLLLLVIDQPSIWKTPLWRSWLIRVFGAGFATAMLIVFGANSSNHYGSQHWIETPLSLGLGWIVFMVVAGLTLMSRSARFNISASMSWDAIYTYSAWVGVYFGIFYIPATGLAAIGTLWMVLPLFGTFLTGPVLLALDPPRRWLQPRALSLWIRFLSSGVAALLLAVTGSVYRDTRTHEVFIGDWQENLICYMGAWGLYAAVAGVTYLMCEPSHEAYDNLSK